MKNVSKLMNSAATVPTYNPSVERRMRYRQIAHNGGFDAVQLHPLGAVAFYPDEGGTTTTNLNVKLAPVNGYLRSKVKAQIVQVFVPYQGIEKVLLDTDDTAGVTEMTRRRLLNGEGAGLEAHSEISEAMNVHGKNVGGAVKVSETLRAAYIAAVNHLRQRAYYDAELLPNTHNTIAPAILEANVLQRFNAVLDPERNIDGAINLAGELPIKGLGKKNGVFADGTQTVRNSEGGTDTFVSSQDVKPYDDEMLIVEEDPNNPGYPYIRANLEGAGEISLRDMMKSKIVDGMMRYYAKLVQDNPEHGEEMVARDLFGLAVDVADVPFVIHEETLDISAVNITPTDGPSINDVQGQLGFNRSFSSLVPRTELGGVAITMVAIKPLEALPDQPDPDFTRSWEVINRVHDQLNLDEVAITRRDLESNVADVDADAVTFWTGHNRLLMDYTSIGPNANQINAVENKSTMWRYAPPTSVTPENVSYGTVDMYPFAYWDGAHAEYTFGQTAQISTPRPLGPNPVERLQIFEADPSLIYETDV